jgi:hypothetical protein
MEVVDEELCIGKEIWFACQTVWTERTSKVIDDSLGCLGPVGYNGRKNIVSPLTEWNTVETITDAVCAPDAHNSPGQPLLTVLCIEF